VLQVERSYLFTWPEKTLTTQQQTQFFQLIQRRAQGEPIAHIIGLREFWSMPLTVNQHTLIPRPDTELLVEVALAKLPKNKKLQVADLGTGTGAIALALATERPYWEITATDCSAKALVVAKHNAAKFNLTNITFATGDWCAALTKKHYHAIISNPPYIDPADPHLAVGDLRFETRLALVSDANGLQDLQMIINHAHDYLSTNGHLMLEHGCSQAPAVKKLLQQSGYYGAITTFPDLTNHARVTIGRSA